MSVLCSVLCGRESRGAVSKLTSPWSEGNLGFVLKGAVLAFEGAYKILGMKFRAWCDESQGK